VAIDNTDSGIRMPRFFVCLVSVLGLELRAYTLSHSTRILRTIAQAGFELQSSCSLPPK
jgi:hypothetical protein